MKPEILVLPEMLEPLCAELEKDFTLHRQWTFAEAELKDRCRNVRGVASNGQCGAPTALIAALPALEIVSVYGVGVDMVDLEAARARDIAITITSGVLTNDVADMVITLMFAGLREVVAGDRFVRSGRWLKMEKPVARRISGKKLGILGFGQIGRAVARKAAPFDMDVAYSDRAAISGADFPFLADPVALAERSDVLVVTCAATPETRGIINKDVVDALGPTGILINVARGSLVDEPALVQALQDGRLGMACLDVFADEPRVPEALMGLENVILQPHQGSGTRECRQEMADLVIRYLRGHFFEGHAITPLW